MDKNDLANESLEGLLYRVSDPRSRELPFVACIYGPLLIIVLYIIMAVSGRLSGGVKGALVSDRKLRRPMLIYNAACVLLSIYVCFEITQALVQVGYNFICTPCIVDWSATQMRLVRAIWIYYMGKYFELLDTVFMVLRGKTRQITVLHVFHHAVMIPTTQYGLLAQGAVHPMSINFLVNSMVHVIMYSYYALSSFRALQPYLFFKRYITSVQLLQFGFIAYICSFNYFVSCGCQKTGSLYMVILQGAFALLFGNFYIRSYGRPKLD